MGDLEGPATDNSSTIEKLKDFDWGEFIFQNRFSLLLVLIGTIAFGLGMFHFVYEKGEDSSKVEILEAASSLDEVRGEIFVEISGAVKNPGVYKYDYDARVEDLLVSAGGLTSDADTVWFERMVNRASKLTDGQKVYIPRANDDRSQDGYQSGDTSANISGGGEGHSQVQGSGSVKLVNVNTATQKELESLWGIGPVTAQNIIEQRPYSTVKELLDRKIIKQNVYDRNKDLMTTF